MGARGKNFYNDYAKRLGFEEAAVTIQDLYLDGKRKEAIAAVPNELVDAVHLVGSEGKIRDRLQAWKEAGKRGEVGTLLLGAMQPEAFTIVAEELL
jgi:alkanesulfonate monooxygenase SsuD/methylene tetrahydromethanopterin reductase-like flavin-dependent oxidoreductase (luciferase family)